MLILFSEVAKIALIAARLGQFQQLLKTLVILILNLLAPMRLPIQIVTKIHAPLIFLANLKSVFFLISRIIYIF